MNRVAIIIPSMDNRQYLEPALASLQQHTQDADYRVIVVNNGSPDSCDWVRDYGADIAGNVYNVGWERGLQIGLDESSEPLVLFLNDDVLFLRSARSWLARLVADLDDATVAAAGPASNMVAGPQSIHRELPEPRYRVRYLIGFCMLVRRTALNEVGGIDTTLPGGDDIDLSMRFRAAGYQLVCNRTAFVYHYGFRTGERLYGPPSKPGGWNSEQMIGATANALIAKHGQAAFDEAWRQDPLGLYHAPVPEDPALV